MHVKPMRARMYISGSTANVVRCISSMQLGSVLLGERQPRSSRRAADSLRILSALHASCEVGPVLPLLPHAFVDVRVDDGVVGVTLVAERVFSALYTLDLFLHVAA